MDLPSRNGLLRSLAPLSLTLAMHGNRQSFHSKHRPLRNNIARSQSSQVNLELAQIGDPTSSFFSLQPLHNKRPRSRLLTITPLINLPSDHVRRFHRGVGTGSCESARSFTSLYQRCYEAIDSVFSAARSLL